MKKASYTVEAVFVCSICIWVLLALMYGSFYIHDRMILGSLTSERAAEHFQRGEQPVSVQWENEMKKELSDALFLMQIQEVEAKKNPICVRVQVKYRLPISVSAIKALFSVKGKGDTYLCVRELAKPMEYRWDADLLRKKRIDKEVFYGA